MSLISFFNRHFGMEKSPDPLHIYLYTYAYEYISIDIYTTCVMYTQFHVSMVLQLYIEVHLYIQHVYTVP